MKAEKPSPQTEVPGKQFPGQEVPNPTSTPEIERKTERSSENEVAKNPDNSIDAKNDRSSTNTVNVNPTS